MIRTLLLSSGFALLAQGPPKNPVEPSKLPSLPAASNPLKEVVRVDLKPEEVGTPEALAASLYAFISGPSGEKRNVERIRSLFHPQARVMVTARHPEKGPFLRPIELETFLNFAIPQWEKGFFERSTGVAVKTYEGMAQVWSPYEIRRSADGPLDYTGVNALQCAWDGKRWWIVHIAFQSIVAGTVVSVEPKK
jgi:hypothetical protein